MNNLLSSTAAKALFVGVCAGALLGGCGTSENVNPTGMTAPQRAAATNDDQALPAPAQGKLAEQNDNNAQMDAMRSQDAAKDRASTP